MKSESKLIEHHVKYKEIHGVDETVWMNRGDHTNLHRRLRREGKCNIPKDVLRKISLKANERMAKTKKRAHLYYLNNNRQIDFCETMMPCVYLNESIAYNIKTKTIKVCVRFKTRSRRKLYNILEVK